MQSDEKRTLLRKEAQARLNDNAVDVTDLDRLSMEKLVEELKIHQIELEIQNEELRNAQLTLEAVKNRYVSLFDNAPNGYVVLDKDGIIKQFNSTFENMVGTKNLKVSGQAFADILPEKDAKAFMARFKSLFKQPEGKSSEYEIVGPRGARVHIQVRAKSHTKHFYASDSSKDELLLMVTDISQLTEARDKFEQAHTESLAREKEVRALLDGARAVLRQTDFDTTARNIFDICSRIIGSTSGYVALLSENGDENEVLFLEAGGLPCTVSPELPMPIRGLRETAYRTRGTVYDNDFMNSDWVKFMPGGHVRLDNVLFAPLVIDEKTVGIMGLANKKEGFTKEDAAIAHGFGKLCAIALCNSQNLDKRNKADKKNERLIFKLQEALANVKQLSGLLPICSHCKKIRDDKGYWTQIELYINEHSDATFSHGICQECAKKYYPDFDIFDK